MDAPGIKRTARADSLGVRGLGCMDLELDLDGRRRSGARPRRSGLRARDVGAAGRARRDRRAGARHRPGGARRGDRLREAARAVRPADRQLPGDPVDARRHGDRAGGGAHADAEGRGGEGHAGEEHRRGVDGQARGVGGGAQGRRQGDADSGVGRLPPRLGRRAPVPRRARDGNLSGHVRGAAYDHRRQRARQRVIGDLVIGGIEQGQ